ncbi:hypothetical protein F7725_014707, partial [Dissostichus mawsoni]
MDNRFWTSINQFAITPPCCKPCQPLTEKTDIRGTGTPFRKSLQMEGGAGNVPSTSGSQRGEDGATKKRKKRNKEQRPGYHNKKVKVKESSKKRNQKTQKSTSSVKKDADSESEDTDKGEMEVVGTSSQTEETRPVETQHVDPQAEDKVQTVEEQSHGDAKM